MLKPDELFEKWLDQTPKKYRTPQSAMAFAIAYMQEQYDKLNEAYKGRGTRLEASIKANEAMLDKINNLSK